MTTINASFSAVGTGTPLTIKSGRQFSYSVSGTFSATVNLEASDNGGQTWKVVKAFTAAGSGTINVKSANGEPVEHRFHCVQRTSGTVVTSISDVAQAQIVVTGQDGSTTFEVDDNQVSTAVRLAQNIAIPAQLGKVGATSGWAPAGANNLSDATCPASQTASTLVIPILGLKVGQKITGFNLNGSVASSGGALTVDAQLRSLTAGASGPTDAQVAAMTQVAVTAATLLSAANTAVTGINQTVAEGQNFYMLITVTTAASTSVTLQSAEITVNEA